MPMTYLYKRQAFLRLLDVTRGKSYWSLAQDLESNIEAVKKMANRLQKLGLVEIKTPRKYHGYHCGNEVLVYLVKKEVPHEG